LNIDIAMITGDRSPNPNYVGASLRALVKQGVSPERIQLFPTTPNIHWLEKESIPAVSIALPQRSLTRVQNGVRLFQTAKVDEWLLHLEDDISFCQYFLGSVERWLTRHASARWNVYTFCAIRSQAWLPLPKPNQEAWPLWESAGGLMAAAIPKQVVNDFASHAALIAPTWRKNVPAPLDWGGPNAQTKWEGVGFDVMFHAFTGPYLASQPSFVQHEGDLSLAHRFHEKLDGSDIRRSEIFAGHDWSYQPKA
jgi:hypothetical protein